MPLDQFKSADKKAATRRARAARGPGRKLRVRWAVGPDEPRVPGFSPEKDRGYARNSAVRGYFFAETEVLSAITCADWWRLFKRPFRRRKTEEIDAQHLHRHASTPPWTRPSGAKLCR